MSPSVAKSSLKLIMPTYIEYDDRTCFRFKASNISATNEQFLFYKAELIERTKVTHFSLTYDTFINPGKNNVPVEFNIYRPEKRKIFCSGSHLKLIFFSNNGDKKTVTYLLNIKGTSDKRLESSITPMTEEEKSIYSEIFQTVQANAANPVAKPIVSKPSISKSGTSYTSDYSASFTGLTIPGMNKYLDALNTEKTFLMLGGGKKYKVTNGRFLSRINGSYAYLFDLDAELYLADDAPIKVDTSDVKTSGTVILCEDFQIIVELESSLGEHVNTAMISVEPWKLLEALEKRLSESIDLKRNSVASTLFSEGPQLATKEPISKILKGQEAVIQKALTDPVTIVWGPPGTGKTHTMSELAIQFMESGKKVLIVSHSNVSVDGVAKKIDHLLWDKWKTHYLKSGSVLRYGYVRDEELQKNKYVNSFYYTVSKYPEKKAELESLQEQFDELKKTVGFTNPKIINLKKDMAVIRAEIREKEKENVSKASIVTTTISKVVMEKMFAEKKFDVVMFDEISMAYVPQVVAAATFARERMICVGDFMQLAPIAQSDSKDVLCEDLFSFLGINRNGTPYNHPWLAMLDEQRRMHPFISEFANKYVYHNLLKNHSSTYWNRDEIVAAPLFTKMPVNLVDLSGTYCAASKNADNSRFNILSALLSFAIAIHTEKNVDTVSVITPYAAQTRLIRALVLDYRNNKKSTEMRCSTVHQFQGSESDVVIFDAVESYPGKKPGWLMSKDFNSIMRLINVAVTRARGKLITVANQTFWDNNFKGTNHTFSRLLSYSNTKGTVTKHSNGGSLDQLIPTLSVTGGPQFYTNPEEYLDRLCNDIKKAKAKIVISLPSGNLDSGSAKKIYSALSHATCNWVKIIIKCNQKDSLPGTWKNYAHKTTNATFPLIMIDEQITWYGAPLASWSFTDKNDGYKTVCPITCRISGERTAEMIRTLTDLEHVEASDDPDDTSPIHGLAGYVKGHKKCSTCGKPLIMTKGKSGKTILWCKNCKKTELLSPDEINHYICANYIRCPQHNCELKAGVSKYGLYIKCDYGHFLKPEDI